MEDVGSLSSSLLLSGPTRAVEARLEDLLNRAQQAVKAIHASMSSAAGEGPPLLSSKEVEALAAEGAKALKEMDAAVQYAQREASVEGDVTKKDVWLARLRQLDRAGKDTRAELRKAVRGVLDGVGVPSVVSSAAQASSAKAFLLARKPTPNNNSVRGLREDAVSLSAAMTQSLQRTRGLMAQELERVQNAMSLMDEDSETLGATYGKHAELAHTIHQADALLRKLKRQEVLDRVAKWGSLCFFFATVLFIVARRLWLPSVPPLLHRYLPLLPQHYSHLLPFDLPPSSPVLPVSTKGEALVSPAPKAPPKPPVKDTKPPPPPKEPPKPVVKPPPKPLVKPQDPPKKEAPVPPPVPPKPVAKPVAPPRDEQWDEEEEEWEKGGPVIELEEENMEDFMIEPPPHDEDHHWHRHENEKGDKHHDRQHEEGTEEDEEEEEEDRRRRRHRRRQQQQEEEEGSGSEGEGDDEEGDEEWDHRDEL